MNLVVENVFRLGTKMTEQITDIDITADELSRMKELQKKLSEAADAYYNKDIEIISNYEYDALYDELEALERKTGVILADSITQRAGVPVESELPKIHHESPMLSLSKTKSRNDLIDWLGDKVGCISWKLDGSTVVLTYDNGELVQAVTRGNGYIGEDITHQARKFAFVPTCIDFKDKLIVRGEALMTYSEFMRVNDKQPESAKYKNPRNLASGTMRALDDSLLDERRVEFHPFTLVSAEGYENNSYSERLDWLDKLGFSPVEHKKTTVSDLLNDVSDYENRIPNNDLPSDGLVLFYDDIEYGDSLGSTGHAPRNGIAFKWQDETKRTTIRDIFWSPSRTGRLNPVAVFDSVDIEGTTVERASLHNISYIEDMKLNIGDDVLVYKANMIIPQIADNLSKTLDNIDDVLPEECPVCHSMIERRNDNGSEYVYCPNEACPAKQIGAFVHFVSRDAMDIRGLSEKKLEVLIDNNFVEDFCDIFNIASVEEYISELPGFGEQSARNLVEAVKNARECAADKFVYALGINNVGRSTAKDLCMSFDNDIIGIITYATNNDINRFTEIDGIGYITASAIVDYFTENYDMIINLLSEVTIVGDELPQAIPQQASFCAGKTFVVTGKLNIFENRDALKTFIESNGGKVAGSISKTTDYLITNTPDSGTKKNLDAKRFGTEIITEEAFAAFAEAPVK